MVSTPDSTPYFNSIILNCNRADFIAATLRSVPVHTFFAPEIIVVDDGSRDNTAEVVRQFTDALCTIFPSRVRSVAGTTTMA